MLKESVVDDLATTRKSFTPVKQTKLQQFLCLLRLINCGGHLNQLYSKSYSVVHVHKMVMFCKFFLIYTLVQQRVLTTETHVSYNKISSNIKPKVQHKKGRCFTKHNNVLNITTKYSFSS